MRKRKTPVTGVVLLTLAAMMLAVFVWHHQAQMRADVAEPTQTNSESTAEPVTEPPGPTLPLMDFSDLLAMNHEVIGRLVIEGIGLDEPVVQGTDNGYYLTRTPERKEHKNGSLFLDYRVSKDFSNFNSVIYGHYRSTGEMFGKLKQLRGQATFDRVPEGMLYTLERTYRLEIFASVLTPATSAFYHYVFLGEKSREAHLEMIHENAVCYRDIGVTADDRLLVLSTCSYEYEDARTVIVARLAT